MLSVNVVVVGNLKEKFWREACDEFSKRLCRFCKLKITEISESTFSGINQTLSAEAKNILPKLCGYVFVLALEGKMLTSMELSEKMDKLALGGVSEITFVIGSSNGLDSSVLAKADFLLCFSKFTFPHQLMRVILLEQIYRAFTISAKMPYHK